ncbi:MAG: hypothetical protein A3F17_02320 [Gammaproteobacteria bacterium RIFCSPHIGHO2_12_FULL_41_15]|nr:MAG: hypothetical protein A3F17_02320 [Gammaproteobacteria bacterium RIFCSPHIGHO2_12_FULL_41_15]
MHNNQLARALNEKAAAAYIGLSVSFLQKDRMNGVLPGRQPGPRYAKLGKRVVYLREDLDAWLDAHLVMRRP